MPTLPSDQPDRSDRPHSREPHRDRTTAESFGADAARYDRSRPHYPRELIDRIVASSPGRSVLDVGCGTGIVARQFQAAGCTVLGVEPDARMAELAREAGVPVEVSTFETWDPSSRTFDVVVAGQAWHWIDPVAGADRAAHALRPDGGRLALFWNVFRPPTALREAFAEVHRRVLPDAPLNPWAAPGLDSFAGLHAQAADGIARARAFNETELWRFDWEQPYTRDEWLEQIPTHGGSNRLAPSRLDALLSGIGTVIDEAGGAFTMGYATLAVTATLAGTNQEPRRRLRRGKN